MRAPLQRAGAGLAERMGLRFSLWAARSRKRQSLFDPQVHVCDVFSIDYGIYIHNQTLSEAVR